MNNDRIAAIRERCEKATPGPWKIDTYENDHRVTIGTVEAKQRHVANWVYLNDAVFIAHSRSDIPYLLTEIDRLTAELFGFSEQLETVKFELLQKTQLLDASKRREQAAVELLVKAGFCSQQPLYECDEERPMACHACITKWCLNGPHELQPTEEQHGT
jgi:hypothetical protein